MRKSIVDTWLVALLLLVAFCVNAEARGKARYVFYLISDGTGVNTVLATEMYRAALEGRVGRVPCHMSLFPVTSMASTWATDNGVTDSAASGTALACGVKTTNEAIGMYPDLKTEATSIALWAKEAGMKVGVASSCPVNHATPAAFAAHRASRNDYYGIGLDMAAAGLDFYAGAEVHNHAGNKGDTGMKDVYDVMREAGYEVAFGMDDYRRKAHTAKKMLLVQDTTRLNPVSGAYSMPYAIDRREGDMTIEEVMRAEIDFLMKDNKRGFLLVNEVGGKVDYACHAVDGATAIAEIEAVDRCVKVAMEFYRQHPDETLIVLTADHETGGIVLLPDDTDDVRLALLRHQKVSTDAFTTLLHDMRRETGNRVTWQQAREALTECFGFWRDITLTDSEAKDLHSVWQKSFEGKAEEEKNLYSANEPLAAKARDIINRKAKMRWMMGGHSAGLVPVYAIGVGQELFTSQCENADIPKRIAKAAGYKTPF